MRQLQVGHFEFKLTLEVSIINAQVPLDAQNIIVLFPCEALYYAVSTQ